jgi:hypothetical protein
MGITDEFTAADFARTLGFVVLVNVVGASPAFLFGADTGWIDDSAWYFPPDVAFPIDRSFSYTAPEPQDGTSESRLRHSASRWF